jgi:hypothetical protein
MPSCLLLKGDSNERLDATSSLGLDGLGIHLVVPSCVLPNWDGDKRQDGVSGIGISGEHNHLIDNPYFLSINKGLFLVLSLFLNTNMDACPMSHTSGGGEP